MVFGRRKDANKTQPESSLDTIQEKARQCLLVVGSEEITNSSLIEGFKSLVPDWDVVFWTENQSEDSLNAGVIGVVALHTSQETITNLLHSVRSLREQREDGYPVLIVVSKSGHLTKLGQWLHEYAVQDCLEGLRLIVAEDCKEVPQLLNNKLDPIPEPNIIKMPLTSEVETPHYKYFYTISPELRKVVSLMQEFAENNISRLYLLGGPGSGKTSVAYYYWLCRNKGKFITVNLTAESTDDKAAMKSLLCGHVTGAQGTSSSREGALAFAEDGVCFLDESHGVTGVVMQTLMEVLDSGQYLPFGGTKKRMLNCAVIMASNRSWETLRNQMQLDEYARLGTTIIQIKDLAARLEDLIAVACTTLAKFAAQCTTWTAPDGLTPSAWQALTSCSWKGNTRTLIRVVESAAISLASEGNHGTLIDQHHIRNALDIWEPESHPSADIYTSYE